MIRKSLKIALFALAFCISIPQIHAQWAGSGTINGNIYRNGNVGIGFAGPPPFLVAPLDVRGSSIFLAPAGTVGFPVQQFTAIGESGGQCDLYGFRAQRNDSAYINVGIQRGVFIPVGSDGMFPTISWGGNDGPNPFISPSVVNPRRLNFNFDDGTSSNPSTACGRVVAQMLAPSQTYQFIVYGDALASGGTWVNSDARYKTDVNRIGNALEMVRSMRGVSYGFNNEEYPEWNFPQGRTYGFIAQELKEVTPDLVQEDETGFHAVNYEGMVPVLVEAIKEQQDMIDELKKELNDVRAKLDQSQRGKSGFQGQSSLNQQARLFNNQPNPFSERTQIRYFLPEGSRTAEIRISDLNGRTLRSLPINQLGEGQVSLEGSSLAAGTYLYSLVVDGRTVATERMVLSK